MALKKDIVSNNGAIANYHRICEVRKDLDKIQVILDSYTNKSFRDSEKRFFRIEEDFDLLNQELYELLSIPEEERTEEQNERIAEIQDDIEFFQEGCKNGNFFLFNIVSNLDHKRDDEEISFSLIYEKLKETDERFKGAEDC